MMPDEEMLDEEVVEDVPVEEPVEGEAALDTGEESPVEGSINLTVDEIPTLSEKAVGDVVSLEVRSISEDGMSFELVPVIEEAPIDEGGAGRSEIENAMMS